MENLKKRRSNRSIFSKVILIVLALGILSSIFGKDKDITTKDTVLDQGTGSVVTEEKVANIIEVGSYTLYKEYGDNEIAADEKYKGKVFIVKGTIENIGKDILNNPYISLKADKYFGSIQCMLSDSETSKASKLKNGQTISLKGEGRGKLGNVLMRECIIL